MQASHNLERVAVSFDDDTLLPNGGLTVAALLAQKLGVADLVDEHVTIDGQAGANSGAKAATVVGSALVGGDCIDDTAVLRAGATRRLVDDTRAPSTVGIWLRAFRWATVRQLDRVARELLARAWIAGLGPDLDEDLTIDIDSTVVETYGLAKQGGGFAYTGVRGYHPLIASLAQTGELLHARLRGGNTRAVIRDRPQCRVLVLTTFDLDEYVYEALRAGASGFLLKTAPPAQLGAAIRACHSGELLFAPTVTRRLVETFVRRPPAVDGVPPELADLTPRELDVLRAMARGLSNAEIAGDLYLGESTVKTHVTRILAKLGLRDRVQAVVLAHETGLLNLE